MILMLSTHKNMKHTHMKRIDSLCTTNNFSVTKGNVMNNSE